MSKTFPDYFYLKGMQNIEGILLFTRNPLDQSSTVEIQCYNIEQFKCHMEGIGT